MSTWTFVDEPLLGTRVEVRITVERTGPDGEGETRAAADMVFAEIARLERVFSVFDDNSELVRWRTGALDLPSAELRTVLALAWHWQSLSEAAFNVAAGGLTELWSAAARTGRPPTDTVLADACARIAVAPYVVTGDNLIERVGDCTAVDLNAFAKGWIADRGAAAGIACAGVAAVLVNAGGDIAHRGGPAATVGIENPAEPYDNAAPLTVVRLRDGGVATSGSVRRGFDVDGRWFGHVLDPRTGRPVETLVSVTAIAGDAATADVAATVASVLGPERGVAFVDGLEGVECLTVDPSGRTAHSVGWSGAVTPS